MNEAARGHHDLQFFYYDWIPCITGLMIDQRHLFLGFVSWDETTGMISDQKDHHTYFERSPQTEKWFQLFKNWHTQGVPISLAVPIANSPEGELQKTSKVL
jgi:hypothetical protein